MPEISWTVSGGDGLPSAPSEKHPYITEKRITEGMSEGQKSFVRDFNSMRNFIEKHNLMDKK
jgi:hypothetical protein